MLLTFSSSLASTLASLPLNPLMHLQGCHDSAFACGTLLTLNILPPVHCLEHCSSFMHYLLLRAFPDHNSKHVALNWYQVHVEPYEVGTILTSMLEIWKLKGSKVKKCIQGYR